MNYTSITLGELLSSDNEIIKKHAVGILKALQKDDVKNNEIVECDECERKLKRKNAVIITSEAGTEIIYCWKCENSLN